MKETYLQDQTFGQGQRLERGEYEKCLFKGGNLSEQDLSQYSFIYCAFDAYNLSLSQAAQGAVEQCTIPELQDAGTAF